MTERYKFSRIAALLISFLMVFSGSVCVFADGTESTDTGSTSASTGESGAAYAQVPAQPDDLYVYDEAAILSDETKSAIETKNADLNAKYGVQIAVVTMTTLPGEKADYAGRAAYLRNVMDTWNIGGSGKNGVLVGMSVSDGDYLAVSGDGLRGAFPNTELSTLLIGSMESDFQAGRYDDGLLKFVDAAASAAETYKSGNPAVSADSASGAESTDPTSSAPESETASSASSASKGGGILSGILTFIAVLVILFVVFLLVVYLHGQYVRKQRQKARRARARQRREAEETQQRSAEDDYKDFMNRYK